MCTIWYVHYRGKDRRCRGDYCTTIPHTRTFRCCRMCQTISQTGSIAGNRRYSTGAVRVLAAAMGPTTCTYGTWVDICGVDYICTRSDSLGIIRVIYTYIHIIPGSLFWVVCGVVGFQTRGLRRTIIVKKMKIHFSCEIEDFVKTHLCKLCVILRSRVFYGVCLH